jgi:CheY-like chemotaxis protein
MRILVVENDPLFRNVLADFLRHEGIQVVALAADGLEALRALDRARPDLILTDWEMPACDGVELVERLRRRGDHTPIVMLSGAGDPDAIARATAAGVNRYLIKPVGPALLTSAIRQTYLATAA